MHEPDAVITCTRINSLLYHCSKSVNYYIPAKPNNPDELFIYLETTITENSATLALDKFLKREKKEKNLNKRAELRNFVLYAISWRSFCPFDGPFVARSFYSIRRVFQRDRGCITYESMGAKPSWLAVYARRATQPAQGTCSTISSVTAVSFIKSPSIGTNASTAKAIRRKLEPTIFPPYPCQQPCTCSSLRQREFVPLRYYSSISRFPCTDLRSLCAAC